MTHSKEKILIVDDEPGFVSQFDTFLKTKGFHVITALGAEEAEARLRENSVAVILADQRMPGTKGVDLLSQIHKEYPDIVRVLVTGYSDLDAVADAINRGAVYRYISKSSFPEEIAAVVSQCLEKYCQDREVKRLTSANRKLLRMLAAEKNLSAFGIFGKEISKKIEEMVLGLSGYLFGDAGSGDPENLKAKFQFLEASLKRIRDLSLILDSEVQKNENRNLNLLIAEERGKLLQAARVQGVKVDLICELDSGIPDISVSVVSFSRLVKELLENAVLFNPDKSKKVVVRSYVVPEAEDPRVQIDIVNPSSGLGQDDLKNFFNPFYTTLGNVDFSGSGSIAAPEDYNLGNSHHYGIGLSVAHWLSCRLGGEINMKLGRNEVVATLTMPLRDGKDEIQA